MPPSYFLLFPDASRRGSSDVAQYGDGGLGNVRRVVHLVLLVLGPRPRHHYHRAARLRAHLHLLRLLCLARGRVRDRGVERREPPRPLGRRRRLDYGGRRRDVPGPAANGRPQPRPRPDHRFGRAETCRGCGALCRGSRGRGCRRRRRGFALGREEVEAVPGEALPDLLKSPHSRHPPLEEVVALQVVDRRRGRRRRCRCCR